MHDPSSAGRLPWLRKAIHVATTVVPVAGWLVSYPVALVLAGGAAVASLLLEAARRWWPWVNHLLWRLIPSVFRRWEERRLLGSTWFALGMLAALALWGLDAGGTAVLFLAWGDPAAEFIGRRWGSPGQRKTLAGSLGCLGACLLAGGLGVWLGGVHPWAVLAGAVSATAIERWSPPPDDNLWIPILSGMVILVAQKLVGG